MTFEYRDADGDRLTAHGMSDDDGRPVVHFGTSSPDGVYVAVDRVEEVIAGIRDAARQAAGQAATEPPAGPRCYVEFVGGSHCAKPFGHRLPCSDDPHRPAAEQPAEAQPAEAHEPARIRIINHPGVLATYDTQIAALLDAYRAEILREAADVVGNDDDCGCGGCDTCVPRKLADELRRMADEETR